MECSLPHPGYARYLRDKRLRIEGPLALERERHGAISAERHRAIKKHERRPVMAGTGTSLSTLIQTGV